MRNVVFFLVGMVLMALVLTVGPLLLAVLGQLLQLVPVGGLL